MIKKLISEDKVFTPFADENDQTIGKIKAISLINMLNAFVLYVCSITKGIWTGGGVRLSNIGIDEVPIPFGSTNLGTASMTTDRCFVIDNNDIILSNITSGFCSIMFSALFADGAANTSREINIRVYRGTSQVVNKKYRINSSYGECCVSGISCFNANRNDIIRITAKNGTATPASVDFTYKITLDLNQSSIVETWITDYNKD